MIEIFLLSVLYVLFYSKISSILLLELSVLLRLPAHNNILVLLQI